MHGLAIGQVGARLLLSDQQVRDLEAGSDRTFHNRGFYLRALRRYAVFSEMPASAIDKAFAEAEATDVPAAAPPQTGAAAAVASVLALLDRWRGTHTDPRITTSTHL